MPIAVAVAVGGAAGALGRWGVDRLIERRSFAVFPWSTFVVNVSGCLLIGAVVAALVDRHHTPLWLRTGLVIGLLGGYTTFSTFAQETLDLLRGDAVEVATGLAYAGGSVVAAVLAVAAGAAVGRLL
jgi:fluoride exporter